MDLSSGKDSAASFTCGTPDEPNVACSGIDEKISVRTPEGGPNDVVDSDGFSFPLEGKVHDCAGTGTLVLVAAGSEVLLLETASRSRRRVHPGSADRVAIAEGWIGWAEGTRLHWMRVTAP